jgi:predicted GH43/DUF377 family glycosyl hydrolase
MPEPGSDGRDHDMLDRLQTPLKHGSLVLKPSYKRGAFDSHAVDCPFLFWHGDRYYMTYVGWDAVGYRTGLASSDDLLTWHTEGMILDRGPAGSVTEFNAALTCILRDNDLYGLSGLKQVDGRFVGTYHAYPRPGYETGPAAIGLCYGDDLYHWDVQEPILRAEDGMAWEAGGLYKSWLLEHEGTYYLFYRAKNRDRWPWIEQIGVALSNDLVHWERYGDNPVLKVGPAGSFDDLFASDPCVLRYGDVWVMFYYGNCSDGHARDSAAWSHDLLHWTKLGQILVDVGPPGSIDARHAHKPGIITRDGTLFHFYCAVSPASDPRIGEIEHAEIRGIAVAHS